MTAGIARLIIPKYRQRRNPPFEREKQASYFRFEPHKNFFKGFYTSQISGLTDEKA